VPRDDNGEWARICRIQAAWATHPETRRLLLDLAAEFQAASPKPAMAVDPDDRILQQSIADRLTAYAARRKLSQRR
jgi:hypothetical protein